VEIVSKESDWVYVKVPRQRILKNGTLVPYEGYIQLKQISPSTGPVTYNRVVISAEAQIFRRNCSHLGCLPEDVEIVVSLGTYLEAISDSSDAWTQVRLATGGIGHIQSKFLGYLPNLQTDETMLRQQIVTHSELQLGWYYFWGGRSHFNDKLWTDKIQVSGVDCSGLVGISYQTAGYLIPRDADPQFRTSKNVSNPSDLKTGDLFFYMDTNGAVGHVMMIYDREAQLLVQSTVNVTKINSIKENFGANIEDLTWHQWISRVGCYLVWGTHFPLKYNRN